MKSLVLTLAALALISPAASAPSINAQLMKLEPETRLEQRCNIRAMGAIEREHKDMHPDELVAYAFLDPVIGKHSIRAPGAAFRTGGEWFHLSYKCKTTDDNLSVTAFSYAIGSVVPRSEWNTHYLVP